MTQKIWLITGVSKGLGREIARCASMQGAIVLGTVRNENDRLLFEQEFNSKAFVIDLSETDKIEPVIHAILTEYERIDVLVNNAGYGAFGMIEEFNEIEIRKQLDVNFIAVWKLCQTILPQMRERKQGTIVQISSRLGIVAGIGNGVYAAGKFALEGLSEALQQELKPFGIKVIVVEPGAMKTDFFGQSVLYAQDKIEDYTTNLGDIRQKTKSINGNQSGDPAKAAEIIVRTINQNVDVFRLPLTNGTILSMQSKIQELKHCIDAFGEIASSIDQ